MMQKQESKRAMLLTQAPVRLMVSLSLPAIVGMVVVGLYTFVDAIYVGQLVGATAMGAVAVAYPFTFVNSGLSSLIGMGSASVLSRAIGANDQRTIDRVAGNLVFMNIVLSSAVTVLGIVLSRASCSCWLAPRARCSSLRRATCASSSQAGLVRELRPELQHDHARRGRAGQGHAHHGFERGAQHRAGSGVHPRAQGPGPRGGGGRMRDGALPGGARSPHGLVVRQAREGRARSRGALRRRAVLRGVESGLLGVLHAGAHARAAGRHLPGRGRMGRGGMADPVRRRTARAGVRVHPPVGVSQAFSRRRARTTARGATPASDASP